MASFAYRLGRAWGSAGPAARAAVGVALALAVSLLLWRQHAEREQRAAAAQDAERLAAVAAAEAASAAAAEVRAKCVTNIATLVTEARADMRAGNPQAAVRLLGECDGSMTDTAAVALLASARKGQEAQAEKARLANDAAARKLKRSQGVTIGMTAQDALDSSWGRPNKVNRTINARGTHEQWVYDGGYLYFQDGMLTAIQN